VSVCLVSGFVQTRKPEAAPVLQAEEIASGQGLAGSDGAADAELAHAGLQSGALHAQKIGGTARAGNTPLGLTKGAEDVLTFGFSRVVIDADAAGAFEGGAAKRGFPPAGRS